MERLDTGVDFVCAWPVNDAGDVEKISIEPIKEEHTLFWHEHYQQIIDKNTKRADYKWIWPVFYHTTITNMPNQYYNGGGYTVGLNINHKPYFIPLSMCLYYEKAPALHDPNKESIYLWYLSSAPKEAIDSIYVKYKIKANIIRATGLTSLDTVVSKAINEKMFGRVGLHASPDGGDFLIQWYQKTGMNQLDEAHPLPAVGIRKPINRKNDGRYFYHDRQTAVAFSQKFDHFRKR